MFLSRVGIRPHGSGWELWPFSMGNKIINPPVNRGQLRGGIWGCKASQSPSCWQVCSGRNPATFMVLVGSTPLLARVTGCEGWPFSMGKNLIPTVSQGQLGGGVRDSKGSQSPTC